MSPQFKESMKQYIKTKHKPFKELVRRILGRSISTGRFQAVGLGLNRDLRYGKN